MNNKENFTSVQFQVTNKCNLNCQHCFKYDCNENGLDFNGFMTKETVDAFFDNDVDTVLLLNFTGGEPLLNIDTIIYTLDKIMNEKRKILQIEIVTNGTILSDPLINKLNEYSKYLYNDLYDRLENFPKDEALGNMGKNSFPINIKISSIFHNSDGQKAYEFYTQRARNVGVKIDGVSEDIVHKKINSIAYSGRAKKLDAEFYVDTPCHKVVYTAPHFIKCPILILHDGTVTISAYCTDNISCSVGAIGNVHSGMPFPEMIRYWNYENPLTCEEACDLEKLIMWKETKRAENLYKSNKEINIEESNKAIERMITEYRDIEHFRKSMHKQYPNMTQEHIEQLQKKIFSLLENGNYTDDEIHEINKLAIQMNNDDFYIELENLHKEYPFLSLEQCGEINEFLKKWNGYYNGSNGYKKDLREANACKLEILKLKAKNIINYTY